MERKKINAKFLLDLDPYPNFKGKIKKKKKKTIEFKESS
jgi:hypothetical protein